MFTPKRCMLIALAFTFVLMAACAPAPTPAPPQVVKETVVVPQTVVIPAATVPVPPAPAKATLKLVGSGKINDPYLVGFNDQYVAEVDFAFIGAFGGEITRTQMSLINPVWYNYLGRVSAVGEIPDLPGYKAVALETATQQTNADFATDLLPFYFSPKGGKYLAQTLGGIAGGSHYIWTKDGVGLGGMQPGDSLAAAGACNVLFNTYQPTLTNGFVIARQGDTFESIAAQLTGDKSKGTELYNYNADRMRYKFPTDLKPSHVLLTPTTWPPNAVMSFGMPRGTSLVVGGKSLSFKPEDPCVYLSASALADRDLALKIMPVTTLPPDVVAYRQRNFSDARPDIKIFSGDWKEGAGAGWFGDPWIARENMLKFGVLMSDMETAFPAANYASRWGKVELEPGTASTIKRLEVDGLYIFRTSSDPVDGFRGGAFSTMDFLKDPAGTNKKVQSAYNGDGTPDAIPFGSLIASQSEQFKNFNFAIARVVAAKTNSAVKLPEIKVAPTETPKPLNIGLVLVGPQNDHGWSEAHFMAAQYIKSKMPNVNWVVIDKLNPADRKDTTLEQVVTDMASKGVKLIITTSDDFQTDTITAAQKHPELTFINASGDSAWKDGKNYKAIPNLGNFMGKMEYMKMVAGCTAALTTQTGKIGFLGPLINDETRRLADSAYLGAKYCWVNYAKKNAADLKFDVTWIGFWFNIPGVTLDPTKVANDFFNSQHDVVISGIDTTEALVVAGQRQAKNEKVWTVSYDFKNGCDEAPNACLGVPYFNWGPRYLKTVQAFAAGTWKPSWDWDSPDWSNLDNPDTGAVGFTFGKALSEANKATVQQFIKGLGDGSINLFKGPITLQDKTVYVKDGFSATDKEIWYLPQLLEGMAGVSSDVK